MSQERKGVGTQTIALSLAMAAAQASLAVMMLLAARGLDPIEFGRLAVVVAIALTANALVDFGMSSFTVREVAAGRMTLAELSGRVIAKTAILLSLSLTAPVLLWVLEAGPLVLAIFPVAASASLSQGVQLAPRAHGYAHRAAAGLVVERLFALAAFVVANAAGLKVASAVIIGLLLGSWVGIVTTQVLVPASFRLQLLARWRLPWRRGGKLGAFMSAVSLQALDVWVLSATAGSAAAGQYAAVNRWVSPLSLLGNAFAVATLPFMARSRSARESWAAIRGALWILVTGAILCLLVAASAAPLVELLLGSEYSESATSLRWLAIGALVAIVNRPVANHRIAMGREGYVAVAMGAVVVIQFGGVIFLAPHFGSSVAATMFLVSQVLLLILLLLPIARSRNRA